MLNAYENDMVLTMVRVEWHQHPKRLLLAPMTLEPLML